MTALISALFQYAAERNFHPYMSIREYSHYASMEEKAEEDIRQLLPPGRADLLGQLHQARIRCASIEQKAAFQAGLAIGLELSRL